MDTRALPQPVLATTGSGRLEQLRSWRRAQGLSQTSLAAKSGLTQAAVSELERGLRVPTLRTVERLAAALGRKPSQLLEEALPQSLSREAVDRIAASIVRGQGRLTPDERRLAEDVGALCIQKLRAHQVAGSRRYTRSRWSVTHRPAWVTASYGPHIVRQILHRIDLLLAMGTWS